MNDLRVLFWNVGGIGSAQKRQRIFARVLEQKFDVCVLAEAALIDVSIETLTHEFEAAQPESNRDSYKLTAVPRRPHSRTGLLLISRLEPTPDSLRIDSLRDDDAAAGGQFVRLRVRHAGTTVGICAVYNVDGGLGRVRPMLDRAFPAGQLARQRNLLLLGDWNFVEHDSDRSSGQLLAYDRRCCDEFVPWAIANGFDEVEQSGGRRQCRTFNAHAADGGSSRIDRLYTRAMPDDGHVRTFVDVRAPGVERVDHHILVATVRVGVAVKRGPGWWCFDNRLLCDDTFIARAEQRLDNVPDDAPLLERIDALAAIAKQYEAETRGVERAEMRELERAALDDADAAGRLRRRRSVDFELRQHLAAISAVKSDDRSNASFFARGRARSSTTIDEIAVDAQTRRCLLTKELPDGAARVSGKHMMRALHTHYSSLLARPDDDDGGAADGDAQRRAELRSLLADVPKLKPSMRDALDADITVEELEHALRRCPNRKVPGRTGLTYECWRRFAPRLLPAVASEVNDCVAGDESGWRPLDPRLLRARITLVSKTTPALPLVRTKRPISALPTWYKVYARVLQQRIATALAAVVPEEQTAFLPGRHIVDNVLLARAVADAVRAGKLPSSVGLVLVDMTSAFDTARIESMWLVLEQLGFGRRFIARLQLLYTGATATIGVNGWLSAPFDKTRGVAQGCPVSPYLFLVLMLVVSRCVGERIGGVRLTDDVRVQTRLYCDDTVCYLGDTRTECREVPPALERAQRITGLGFSPEKTKVWMPAGAPRIDNGDEPIDTGGLSMLRDDDTTRNLGDLVGGGMDDRARVASLITSTVAASRHWHFVARSAYGRCMVARACLASKFVYFASFLRFTKDDVRRVQRILDAFVWRTPYKPNYADARKHRVLGGLQTPHFESMLEQAHVRWLLRAHSAPDSPWKALMRSLLGDSINARYGSRLYSPGPWSSGVCDSTIARLERSDCCLSFVREWYATWRSLGPCVSPREKLDQWPRDRWLHQPLRCNPLIRAADGNELTKRDVPAHLSTVGDLLDDTEPRGRLLTAAELTARHCNGNFLAASKIVAALPIEARNTLARAVSDRDYLAKGKFFARRAAPDNDGVCLFRVADHEFNLDGAGRLGLVAKIEVLRNPRACHETRRIAFDSELARAAELVDAVCVAAANGERRVLRYSFVSDAHAIGLPVLPRATNLHKWPGSGRPIDDNAAKSDALDLTVAEHTAAMACYAAEQPIAWPNSAYWSSFDELRDTGWRPSVSSNVHWRKERRNEIAWREPSRLAWSKIYAALWRLPMRPHRLCFMWRMWKRYTWTEMRRLYVDDRNHGVVTGVCDHPPCRVLNKPGTPEHALLYCIALNGVHCWWKRLVHTLARRATANMTTACMMLGDPGRLGRCDAPQRRMLRIIAIEVLHTVEGHRREQRSTDTSVSILRARLRRRIVELVALDLYDSFAKVYEDEERQREHRADRGTRINQTIALDCDLRRIEASTITDEQLEQRADEYLALRRDSIIHWGTWLRSPPLPNRTRTAALRALDVVH
ncbi:MAG: reverse transcriptase family protein [Pseudomonadota bacterium]|nr:reverse transcriptase family protein [Pseudomonadota bacterium]